jgi:hypothetical protein
MLQGGQVPPRMGAKATPMSRQIARHVLEQSGYVNRTAGGARLQSPSP